MHTEPYEKIEYKGFIINVWPDDMNESPESWGDSGLFLTGYHSDFWVKGIEKISKELAQDIARGGKYDDNSINENAAEYIKEYHIFGLEAYIHSGVALALSQEGNFPDRRWDVSQLGLVFASKAEFKTRDKAEEAARTLIKTWNEYLSGNVWGFTIKDAAGNEHDSCWSYYGDYEKSMIPECKTVIDNLVKNKISIESQLLCA